MKIGFVTDTNIIRKDDDKLSEGMILDTTDIFIEYIDALKKIDTNHTLIYFMPDFILQELFEQKKDFFQKNLEELNKIYKKIKYGLNGQLPKNNFADKIEKENKKYFSKYQIITLESSKELMDELINDAINKTPPFDKSIDGKKTDAGFKDALIWKTVLNSKEIGECNLFYFFSSYHLFQVEHSFFIQQFRNHHPKTEIKIVYIKPDGNQRQKSLQIIIQDNKLNEPEFVKLYSRKYILSQIISSIEYNLKEEISYPNTDKVVKIDSILFTTFTEEDFIIDDVNKIDDNYDVLVSFSTYKYTLDNQEIKEEFPLLGNIKLCCKIENKKVIVKSYNISDIRFKHNFGYGLLKGTIEALTSLYNNEYKNQISDLASKCIQLTKEMNYNNQFTLLGKILSSSVLDGLNNNLSIYNEFLQNNDDIVNIDTKTNND